AAPEQVGQARAVRQDAAGDRNLSGYEHSRYAIVGEKIDDPSDAELVEGIVGHQERLGALPDHSREGVVEFVGTAHREGEQLYPQCGCRPSHLCKLDRMGRIIRIPKEGYARERGRTSLSSCTRFPATSAPRMVFPVILPPGRARLGTSPDPTGS